jgi:hypothetical protein
VGVKYSTKQIGYSVAMLKEEQTEHLGMLDAVVVEKLAKRVEQHILGNADILQQTVYSVPSEKDGVSTASTPNVEQLRNWIRYGFFNVRPIQQSSGAIFVSTDKDGKPTDDSIMADPRELAEVAKIRAKMIGRK